MTDDSIVVARIPVMLPGTSRNWVSVEGLATINSNGEMYVKLRNPESAEALVEMAKNNVLLQLAFDYRMDVEHLSEAWRTHYDDRMVEKIEETLFRAGYGPELRADILDQLKKAGFLFRERSSQ